MKEFMIHIGIHLSVIVFFLLLMANTFPSSVYSDDINPGVHPIDSMINGKTYGDYVADWWVWFSGIPALNNLTENLNPSTDITGKNCAVSQADPNMWYLILTQGIGSPIERTCTIPSDRSIFVPLMANDCDSSEAPNAEYKTRDQFLDCAKKQTDSAAKILQLTVDGKPFKELEKYRIQSPLFNVTYPENPVYEGVVPGTYLGAADGYFVILEPLSPGQHELHIMMAKLNPPKGSSMSVTPSIGHDVKYHLLVE